MNLQPLYDRVIIKPRELSETTSGGLVIPSSVFASTTVAFGEVLAVGPGFQNDQGNTIPPMVTVGQTVVFDQSEAHQIQIEGEMLNMVRAHQIFAILA